MSFSGVYVPVITPFDEAGHVDVKQLSHVVEVLLTNGVDGVVAVGTTGEAYALTFDERHHVISAVVKQVAGRVPVLAGVGGMSTHEAIDQAGLAKRLGCDGLMLAAPAYVLPTPHELAVHVQKVVKSVGMATVLYDYPARTGVPFGVDTLDELVDNDLIQGIKEASGDLSRIETLGARYGDKLQLICGADADSNVFMDSGATCWIGGMANALPKAHAGIMNPETRTEAHAAVLPLLEYIESGRYIAKTKALMSILGLDVTDVRGPLLPATEEEFAALRGLVEQAGDWAPRLV